MRSPAKRRKTGRRWRERCARAAEAARGAAVDASDASAQRWARCAQTSGYPRSRYRTPDDAQLRADAAVLRRARREHAAAARQRHAALLRESAGHGYGRRFHERSAGVLHGSGARSAEKRRSRCSARMREQRLMMQALLCLAPSRSRSHLDAAMPSFTSCEVQVKPDAATPWSRSRAAGFLPPSVRSGATLPFLARSASAAGVIVAGACYHVSAKWGCGFRSSRRRSDGSRQNPAAKDRWRLARAPHAALWGRGWLKSASAALA